MQTQLELAVAEVVEAVAPLAVPAGLAPRAVTVKSNFGGNKEKLLTVSYLNTPSSVLNAGPLSPTATQIANYTAAANQFIPVNATSAAITVSLPANSIDQARVIVKKIDSSTNVVTVQAVGNDVINTTAGPITTNLNVQYQTVTLQYASASGIWFTTSSEMPYSAITNAVATQALTDSAAYVPAGGAYNPIERWVSSADPGYTSPGITSSNFDFTPALQRAIAAFPERKKSSAPIGSGQGGNPIDFGPRDYIINNVQLPLGVTIRGSGAYSTRIMRSSDNPIFWAAGVKYGVGQTAGYPSTGRITIEQAYLSSASDYQSPLVSLQGAAGNRIQNVVFDANNCTHLYLDQVYDSRFLNVAFFGGGRSDGTGVLAIGGGNNGYKCCMECQFNNLWFESYIGPAITTPVDQSTFKANTIHLTDVKMESRYCTIPELVLSVGNLNIKNVYISSWATVVKTIAQLQACRTVKGDIRFAVVNSGNIPTAALQVDANCLNVSLDVLVSESFPAGMTVVQQDVTSETIDIQVHSPDMTTTFNGTNNITKTLRYGTIRQRVSSSTTSAVQSIAKDGHPEWAWGNPTTNGSYEDFYIRAITATATTNFLTLRSEGTEPSTAARDVIFNAAAVLGQAWNSVAPLKLGSYVFWIDANNCLRLKNGTPTSDLDGALLTAQAEPVATQSGGGTLLSAQKNVLIQNGGSAVLLPDAAAIKAGKYYRVKNTAATSITVGPTGSNTIDGSTSAVTIVAKGVGKFLSDGTQWWQM